MLLFAALPALVALIGSAATQEPGPPSIRVACLGDSITQGGGLADAAHHAYPHQCAHRLGSSYEVRNFGVSSRTLLRKADLPYTDCEAFGRALAWSPDIVTVMLGTNDTCDHDSRPNWRHEANLEEDARALVESLREGNADVRVLLLAPPPMFPDKGGLSEERKADLGTRSARLARIGHALATVAREEPGVEYHDIGRSLEARHATDGAHLDPFGNELLADRLAEVIRLPFDESCAPVQPLTGRGDRGAGRHVLPRIRALRLRAS